MIVTFCICNSHIYSFFKYINKTMDRFLYIILISCLASNGFSQPLLEVNDPDWETASSMMQYAPSPTWENTRSIDFYSYERVLAEHQRQPHTTFSSTQNLVGYLLFDRREVSSYFLSCTSANHRS